MEFGQNDFERVVFFEHARKIAEESYAKNPLDAENLTRWGGALLELSQFQNSTGSVTMIKEAITRLDEALELNPKKHEALWCLGNAHTSHAFLVADQEMSKSFFTKAAQCFQKAVDEEPGNDLYRKSLEVTAKFSQAPDLQLELQRQVMSQQGASEGSSTSTSKPSKKAKSNELKYDICGWIILVVGVAVWVGMAKSHVPPPPPM